MRLRAGLVAHDLAFIVVQEGLDFSLEIEYSEALFDRSTITRLAEHFLVLLNGMLDRPDAPLLQLALATPQERDFILDMGRHKGTFSADKPIHEWITRQAERSPESIAVTFGERICSYRELDTRSNQIAHALIRLGVGRDIRVAVLLDRSIELIAALLGVLKAGGAYVPIEPTNPADRIEFVLNDSHSAVLLTDREHLAALGAVRATCLVIEPNFANLHDAPSEKPQVQVDTDALAYVIYTSGSTGQPKGVLIEHGHVARLFEATRSWFRFDNHDVWTMFHSVAFDFSVWEIWGALCYGGRLVVVPYATSRSPEDFFSLLVQERVTI